MKSSFSGFGKKGSQEESEDKTKIAQEQVKEKQDQITKEQKEKPVQDQQVAKQSEHYLWLKALFGGILFLGSSVSLYLLFRYKKKFMVSK